MKSRVRVITVLGLALIILASNSLKGEGGKVDSNFAYMGIKPYLSAAVNYFDINELNSSLKNIGYPNSLRDYDYSFGGGLKINQTRPEKLNSWYIKWLDAMYIDFNYLNSSIVNPNKSSTGYYNTDYTYKSVSLTHSSLKCGFGFEFLSSRSHNFTYSFEAGFSLYKYWANLDIANQFTDSYVINERTFEKMVFNKYSFKDEGNGTTFSLGFNIYANYPKKEDIKPEFGIHPVTTILLEYKSSEGGGMSGLGYEGNNALFYTKVPSGLTLTLKLGWEIYSRNWNEE